MSDAISLPNAVDMKIIQKPLCKFILLNKTEETFKLSASDTARQPTNSPENSPNNDKKTGDSPYENGESV